MEGLCGQLSQVTVVSQVKFLKVDKAFEGVRVDEGDVVGIDPEGDHGRAEVTPQQQGDLIVLEEDPLAVLGDPLWNGEEVVGLTANGHG